MSTCTTIYINGKKYITKITSVWPRLSKLGISSHSQILVFFFLFCDLIIILVTAVLELIKFKVSHLTTCQLYRGHLLFLPMYLWTGKNFYIFIIIVHYIHTDLSQSSHLYKITMIYLLLLTVQNFSCCILAVVVKSFY